TATRSICLQGSPNLSQVAMLLAHPQGNLEIASLLIDKRDAFDYILDQVEIDPAAVSLDELDLQYERSDDDPKPVSSGCRLQGGEWREGVLILRFQGEIPALQDVQLSVANRLYAVNIRRQGPGWLELAINEDTKQQLTRPVPVQLRWGVEHEGQMTNPVFVCNEAALNAVIKSEDAPEVLSGIGDLDLDDDELERLLGELDASLMIDRQSVWQLAGRPLPSVDAEDDEALRIDYADVDYELLRRHPKIQQYLRRHGVSESYARTRLQIILNAITDHFRGLLDVSAVDQIAKGIGNELADSESESEQEAEEIEAEKARRRYSKQKRVRRLLINFIRRYLRGIRSPDFQELAGYEVMAQN
ncbi:hypothetical protein LCGC14_3036230, partial [marine sediment metagenome]